MVTHQKPAAFPARISDEGKIPSKLSLLLGRQQRHEQPISGAGDGMASSLPCFCHPTLVANCSLSSGCHIFTLSITLDGIAKIPE